MRSRITELEGWLKCETLYGYGDEAAKLQKQRDKWDQKRKELRQQRKANVG